LTKPGEIASAADEAGEAPGPDRVDLIEAAWRRERPDIDVSSVGIVTRIWRVGRHLERHRKQRLELLGTDRVTLDVLATLRRSGPPYQRSAGQLMHSALITSGGVSQRLEKLERAGLITRQMDPADRRKVEVALTPAGVELVDSVVADVMEHETKLLTRLTPEEQATLTGLLRKLLGEFE
jgi:DNA-binding MarR family transcriptional regulator